MKLGMLQPILAFSKLLGVWFHATKGSHWYSFGMGMLADADVTRDVGDPSQYITAPALVAGDWITILLRCSILLLILLLVGTLFCLNKRQITYPTGILNPASLLRVAGLVLVISVVALLWDLYATMTLVLFVLAGESSVETKMAVVHGVLGMREWGIVIVVALGTIWAVLSGTVRSLRWKWTRGTP